MKLKSLLFFATLTCAASVLSAEFEGAWKIEKKECSNHGTHNLQEFQGMATIPNLRCSDKSEWIFINKTLSPENIEITYYDDNSQSYNHRTFHCFPSSVLNFPEGLCAGYHFGRHGLLKLGKEKSQVFYTESKFDHHHHHEGSYQYSMELEKISSDKYKMTRQLKFWLRPPFIQDTTQVLYLVR